MNTTGLGNALAAACLVCAIAAPITHLPSTALARTDGIVVPNAWETVEGGTFLASPLHTEPFGEQDSARYQQVYAADQFGDLGGSAMIEAIVMRPDAGQGFAYGPATYLDVEVRLSTTSVGPGSLSAFFASNVGPDEMLVFSGALTLSCNAVTLPDGTSAFDIVIGFDQPFPYDPSEGNLLLDFVNPHDTSETFWDYETSTNGAVGSLLGLADSPTANWVGQNAGFITRIEYVAAPCPADVDDDGVIGFSDLLAVLSNWGPCAACPADVDGDGLVGFSDVLLILSEWGSCP